MSSKRYWVNVIFHILTILIVAYGFLSPSAFGAAEGREKAETEGKVVLYASMSAQDCKVLTDTFMQIYPKISAQFVRSSSAPMGERILSEVRAGKNIWDVVIITPLYIELFKQRDLLEAYDSPERKYYREGYKDPQKMWTSTYTNYAVFGYNTKQLSREALPKSHDDLLKPEWKGQICIESKAYEWFATMLKQLGEDNGLTYMRKLTQNHLHMRTGRTLIAQLVAAGEIKCSLSCFSREYENMKAIGAPVDWIALDPVVAYLHPMGLAAKAPHPSAGKLFIDFVLSRKGQETLRFLKMIPDRIDILPDPPRLVEGISPAFPPPDIYANFNRYIKLYNEIFWKK